MQAGWLARIDEDGDAFDGEACGGDTIDVDDACDGDGCWKRIEDVSLTGVDKKELLNGNWNNKEFHASRLLMKQDRDVSSLQNPLFLSIIGQNNVIGYQLVVCTQLRDTGLLL